MPSRVAIEDVRNVYLTEGTASAPKEDLEDAFIRAVSHFGGLERLIPTFPDGKIYIKINGVHFSPRSYTDPGLLRAVIKVLQEKCKSMGQEHEIVVLENCTSGNITRVMAEVTGYASIVRELGARFLFMDEGPVYEMKIGPDHDQYSVTVCEELHRELVRNREKHILINLPKLKCHWLTRVTLGIKNGLGYMTDASKAFRHDYHHHSRLVDILNHVVYPTITVVDGLIGVARGPAPPKRLLDDVTFTYGILLAGTDIVAVDTIGSLLLGRTEDELKEIDHIRIAAERGLGTGTVTDIDVLDAAKENDTLGWRTRIQHLPWEVFSAAYKDALPPRGRFILAENKYDPSLPHEENMQKGFVCYEGCWGLSLDALEYVYNDFAYGKPTPFTIVCGCSIPEEKLEKEVLDEGPILVMGTCTVDTNAEFLERKYGKDRVRKFPTCANLSDYTGAMMDVLGIDPFNIIPIPMAEGAYHLFLAQANNLNSSTPAPSLDITTDILSSQFKNIPENLRSSFEFIESIRKVSKSNQPDVRAKSASLLCTALMDISEQNITRTESASPSEDGVKSGDGKDHFAYLSAVLRNLLNDPDSKVVRGVLRSCSKLQPSLFSRPSMDDIKKKIQEFQESEENSLKKLALKIHLE